MNICSRRRFAAGFFSSFLTVLAACDEATTTDAGTGMDARADAGFADAAPADTGLPDTGLPDTGLPDTGLPDTGPADTGVEDSGLPDPIQRIHTISATGHDRLFGAISDSSGNIFATGVVSDSTTAPDFSMLLVKLTPSGELDPNFGSGGSTRINVAMNGGAGELARGIVFQSTGKIVISGTIEHEGATDARDRDIALVRFHPDGMLDLGFGMNGIVILDLSDGEVAGSNYVADSVWGLSVFDDDDLLIVGSQKAEGRTDSDFAVVRLTPDGDYDDSFDLDGVFTLDINNQSANPRTGTILADGSIVVAGYMSENGVVSPVIFKLSGTGELDPDFAGGGVYNEIILPLVTEAYGAALQGTSFVTTGYGRSDMGESLDWLSIRVLADGTRDLGYGMSGLARIDVAGFNDNARALLVLDDQRVVMIGGGRPASDNIDGMIAVLEPNGAPDTGFATGGFRLFDLGGAADFFWGVSRLPHPGMVAVVGLRGAASGSGGNDDAAVLILPIP